MPSDSAPITCLCVTNRGLDVETCLSEEGGAIDNQTHALLHRIVWKAFGSTGKRWRSSPGPTHSEERSRKIKVLMLRSKEVSAIEI